MRKVLMAVAMASIMIVSSWVVFFTNNDSEGDDFDYESASKSLHYSFDDYLSSGGFQVFRATIINPDNGSPIEGLAFCNYADVLEQKMTTAGDVESNTFGAGFFSFERDITLNKYGSLEIHPSEYEDDDRFLFTTEAENLGIQYVSEGYYQSYTVVNGLATEIIEPLGKSPGEEGYLQAVMKIANPNLPLYDYDSDRYLNYDFTELFLEPSSLSRYDYEEIIKKVNTIVQTQDYNFVNLTIDTISIISKEAIDAYLDNINGGTFFGYSIKSLKEMIDSLEPDSFLRISSEGYEVIKEMPLLTKWLYGLGCAIVIGLSAAMMLIPGINVSAGVLAAGAIGMCIDLFSQTVIQGQEPDALSLLISGLSGALCAIPGVNLFVGSLIDSASQAIYVALKGGSIEDVLYSATVGLLSGLVIGKIGEKFVKHSDSISKNLIVSNDVKQNLDYNDFLKIQEKKYNQTVKRDGKDAWNVMSSTSSDFPIVSKIMSPFKHVDDYNFHTVRNNTSSNSHYFELYTTKNNKIVSDKYYDHVSVHENSIAGTDNKSWNIDIHVTSDQLKKKLQSELVNKKTEVNNPDLIKMRISLGRMNNGNQAYEVTIYYTDIDSIHFKNQKINDRTIQGYEANICEVKLDYDPDVDYTDYLKYDYHTIQDNNNVKSITNKTDMFWKPDNVSGEWKDYSNNRNNSNGVIGVVLSQIMDAISGLDLHIPTRY